MEAIDILVVTRISDLISGYLLNNLSIVEVDELQKWVDISVDNRDILEKILNESILMHSGRVYKGANTAASLIDAKIKIGFGPAQKQPKQKNEIWWLLKVAASIILIFGLGVYLWKPSSEVRLANQIMPGRNTATLILANGKTIKLSESKTGIIIHSSHLTYNDGTKVKAQGANDPNPNAILTEQIIKTPKGGTYQLVLSDGTKVWLNAASSLKYTTSFNGFVNRKVELIGGEAYFEVAKNPKLPFIVHSPGQDIEVLGTHFNVKNNSVQTVTTLVEGAIRIRASKGKIGLLKPGQQAKLKGDLIQIINVATGPAIAWKNGDFEFRDESITDIMDKLALWYNVEVFYEGKITLERFNGKISRQKNIAEILRMLEATKAVQFKIEGRRVTVKKDD